MLYETEVNLAAAAVLAHSAIVRHGAWVEVMPTPFDNAIVRVKDENRSWLIEQLGAWAEPNAEVDDE